MPREWPSIARFAGWRKRCAPADARTLLADATDAFIDRAPVDWRALEHRSRTAADRAVLENLRLLDTLRHSSCSAADAHRSTPLAVWLVITLAFLHISASTFVLAAAWTTGVPIAARLPQILLAVTFAFGAVALGATWSGDARRVFLLATFACAASAFARGALTAVPHAWPATAEWMMRGLSAEMFLPACLWRFALDFPRVRRFTRFDVLASRITFAAWLLGSVVFGLNVAVAYAWVDGTAVASLLPTHRSNLFWRVFTAAVLLAIAAIFIRSRRAPTGERARVARFALALTACASPFLLLGVVRTILPVVDGWLRTATPPERLWVDSVIVTALAAMPLLSTAVVVLDRPFELRAAGRSWRSVLTKVALWFCGRVEAHAAEYQRWVARGLDDLRTARGTREIAGTLERVLARATGAARVSVLTAGQDGRFRDRRDAIALASDSVILWLLHESERPLDLSAHGSILPLLPSEDRAWSTAHGVELAAPIVCRDGSVAAVVLLGGKSAGAAFNRRDGWLVRSLAAAAAVALDNDHSVRAIDCRGSDDELAFECPRCHVVSGSAELACGCGRDAVLAALPRHLAGVFLVDKRLGAGGMGVVYRARDTRLGRDVALKTLSALDPRRVARLRIEAQAMAALNHDALATIYGLEFFRQTPVLIVEYLSGGTLTDRIARSLCSPRDAVRLGIVLAEALAYMHERGVLHRDLKPSNIGFSDTGQPRLLDFGLATLFRDADDRTAVRLAGTLAYLPPEALRGAPPGPSFDLWALALVMLEAITGVNPVASDDSAETARRILRIDSSVVSASLVGAPVEVRAFFIRALSPAPDQRHSSSRELLAALEALTRA